MKNLNIHKNRWVAFSSDKKKVIMSASSIEELDAEVKRRKLKDVIYSFILPAEKYYSP